MLLISDRLVMADEARDLAAVKDGLGCWIEMGEIRSMISTCSRLSCSR